MRVIKQPIPQQPEERYRPGTVNVQSTSAMPFRCNAEPVGDGDGDGELPSCGVASVGYNDTTEQKQLGRRAGRRDADTYLLTLPVSTEPGPEPDVLDNYVYDTPYDITGQNRSLTVACPNSSGYKHTVQYSTVLRNLSQSPPSVRPSDSDGEESTLLEHALRIWPRRSDINSLAASLDSLFPCFPHLNHRDSRYGEQRHLPLEPPSPQPTKSAKYLILPIADACQKDHGLVWSPGAVMSRFWPHTPLAEDQPLARTILTIHVFTRALTMGSLIGPSIATPVYFLRQFNLLKPSLQPQNFSRALVRSAGFGGAVTMGLMCVALPGRMWGREDIEWKDRSWRLLENQGQLETDDWTYGGMALGALAGTKLKGLGWRGAVGSLGLGSVVGMVSYLGWRYGVKAGVFDESKP